MISDSDSSEEVFEDELTKEGKSANAAILEALDALLCQPFIDETLQQKIMELRSALIA